MSSVRDGSLRAGPEATSSRRSSQVSLWGTLPPWLGWVVAACLAFLVVSATIWVLATTIFTVPLLLYTVVVSFLAAAMLGPLVTRLVAVGVYRWLAALLAELALVGAVLGVFYLMTRRALRQLGDLQSTVNLALVQLRDVLIAQPFSLPPETATEVRDRLVGFTSAIAPSASAAATMVLQLMTGAAIALFLIFFLLKDGPKMWGWVLSWVVPRRRTGTQEMGKAVWKTLTAYVQGLVVVASIDAIAIGGTLFVLGVPLALSLSLIVFFGSFVPLLGATVSGALAVVVTAATLGMGKALIVLVVVLVVQQLEGNVLAPLITGRAVNLHPVVVLLAVTAGALVAGIGGALIAVPLVAVVHVVLHRTLRPPADDHRREADGRHVS